MFGYNTILTSEINKTDVEIIENYHGHSRIEDAFRVIKSDLEGRPVYVRTREHINAHFLICFIALT
ncbi:MAG: transposase, partial [Christensenellaceae bacterium]|nr:transposase [Christensenellaceae bacterium]